MRSFHIALILGVAGCYGTIGDGGVGGGAGGGAGGDADGGASTAGGGLLLPARIRRLTNAEFDATTHALLGTSQTFAATFAKDVRQGSYVAGGFPAAGFTRNAAAI